MSCPYLCLYCNVSSPTCSLLAVSIHTTCTCAVVSGRELLQTAPWDAVPAQPILYDPKEEVVVTTITDNRVPVVDSSGVLGFLGEANARSIDADGEVYAINNVAQANYPNPKTANPNGWRVKTKARGIVNLATDTEETVGVYNLVNSNSKLAPAISKAATTILSSGSAGGFAATDASALARPGLQYGVTVAEADQYFANTAQDTNPLGLTVATGVVADAYLSGVARARADAGQGISVALARNVMQSNVGGVASDVRHRANAARWYMAPGHAIGGSANIGRSGRIYQYTQGRVRSDLGSSTSGILNW